MLHAQLPLATKVRGSFLPPLARSGALLIFLIALMNLSYTARFVLWLNPDGLLNRYAHLNSSLRYLYVSIFEAELLQLRSDFAVRHS